MYSTSDFLGGYVDLELGVSEASPTKDLFSVMISTASTRATFISSVKSALSTYGLDGIGR